MSEHVLTNSRLVVNSYNISCDLNRMAIRTMAETRDATTFCDAGWRTFLGSLKSGTIEMTGFGYSAASSAPDPTLKGQLGASVPFSFIPENYTDGNIAYWGDGYLDRFDLGGAVGDIYGLDAALTLSDTVRRGYLMDFNTAFTTTANSTPIQLGAVGADNTMYAQLHVFSASGTSPTLDVVIQHDSVEAFNDDPTAYITFTQATDVGEEELNDDTETTDEWWRITATIGGSDTPTFGFCCIAAIV